VYIFWCYYYPLLFSFSNVSLTFYIIKSNLWTTTTLETYKQAVAVRSSEVAFCYKFWKLDLRILVVVVRWSLAQVWLTYSHFVFSDTWEIPTWSPSGQTSSLSPFASCTSSRRGWTGSGETSSQTFTIEHPRPEPSVDRSVLRQHLTWPSLR
jgi:hypothetical protein